MPTNTQLDQDPYLLALQQAQQTATPPAPTTTTAPPMSDPLPPVVATPPATTSPFPVNNDATPTAPLIPQAPQAPVVPQAGFAPAQVALGTAAQILNSNGAYMSNARRKGLESAAARGLGNSSIAAGAAQRAAIDGAAPLISSAMNLQGQREQLAFQGEQAGLGRNHDFNMAKVQDWLSNQQFSREFNGALALMPINSAYQLNSLIQTYALENPEVYTPQVINGMSNFFNQNFLQILSTYFPSYNQGSNP